MQDARRRRLRLAVVLAAVVVFVAVCLPLAALAANRQGMAQLDAALDEADARHGTADALLAALPPVDVSAQRELRAAFARFGTLPAPLGTERSDPELVRWLADPSSPVPASVRKALDSCAADLAEWRRCMARPGVLVGFGGSTPRRLELRDWPGWASSPQFTASLLECRHLMTLLGIGALADRGEGPWLDDMERLARSLDRSPILIEAMIGIALGNLRDERLLQLAVGGRLGAEALRRWCAEPPTAADRAIAALRGELVLFQAAGLRWARTAARREVVGILSNAGEAPAWARPAAWWGFARDGRDAARQLRAWSQRLARLGEVPADPPMRMASRHGAGLMDTVLGVSLPNLQECLQTAAERDQQHVLLRMSARLAAPLAAGAEEAPADAAEALARLRDPRAFAEGQRTLALCYERLAPRSFRIVCDPVPSPSSFLQSVEHARWTGSSFAPPVRRPGQRVVLGKLGVLVDLDALAPAVSPPGPPSAAHAAPDAPAAPADVAR